MSIEGRGMRFFFKDILNVVLIFRKVIFCWIKPCLFFAESNSPKYLFLHLAADSVLGLVFVLFFFLLDYQPTLHSWFQEPYALDHSKSYFYKHISKYSCKKHMETGEPVGDLWKPMTQTAECPEVSFNERGLGTSPWAQDPMGLVLDLHLLSPKCLRPILVGSCGLKTCFHWFSPKWGNPLAPVNDGGVQLLFP